MRDFSDKMIIVTGGAGFIGSGVVRHLNDNGFINLVVVDHLGKDEKWKNLVGKQFLDIIEPSNFFPWLEGREGEIGGIIHLGACSSTVENDASYLLENNYQFTKRLAQYALKNEIRFIYASSAATYGDGALGFSDDHELLETLRPMNMYGYSKHLFDLWAKRNGLLNEIVGLKFFNVFGPNEYHKGRMSSAVMKFLPQIESKGMVHLFKSSSPELYTDGGQMRDFIYVKDVARITCEFLFNDAGGIFNVGMGEPSTWNQLAEAVFKATNKPVKIEYVSMPDDLIGKYQNFTCADTTKLKGCEALNSKMTPLGKAVEDYVQNYLIHEAVW
jgi:ADP-L-glycero-D-manno-heptose 6-epimerase